MILEHLNIVVRQLDETLAFYKVAFPHWRVRGQGTQTWYGIKRRWMHFGDDDQYITFNDSGTGFNRDLQTNDLGLSHFGYITHNIEALIERLDKAGFPIAKNGNNTPFRKNVYFTDPNGFEIEFIQYSSDLPKERNQYE